MSNDLKYGLILGAVCILIFIGWLAIGKPENEAGLSEEPVGEAPISTEPNMFTPPPAQNAGSRPPQTAEMEFSAPPAEETVGTTSEDVSTPMMHGISDAETYPPIQPIEEIGVEAVTEPAVKTYVVQRGDLLSTISKKFYGTTGKWRQIYEANREVISDPDVLKVGTEIVIPDITAADPGEAAVRVERREPGTREGAGRTHKVASGDTLYSIAAKYYGDGNQWSATRYSGGVAYNDRAELSGHLHSAGLPCCACRRASSRRHRRRMA
jgi:LysM repeat protein